MISPGPRGESSPPVSWERRFVRAMRLGSLTSVRVLRMPRREPSPRRRLFPCFTTSTTVMAINPASLADAAPASSSISPTWRLLGCWKRASMDRQWVNSPSTVWMISLTGVSHSEDRKIHTDFISTNEKLQVKILGALKNASSVLGIVPKYIFKRSSCL